MLNLNNQIYPPEKISEIIRLISTNLLIETLVLSGLVLIYLFKTSWLKSALVLALIVELFFFARGNLFTTSIQNLTLPPPPQDFGLSRYVSTSDALPYLGPQVYFNHLRVRQPFAPDLSDNEINSFNRLRQEITMLPGNLNIFSQTYNASGYSAVVLKSYADYFSSQSVNGLNPLDLSDPRLAQVGVNYLISGYPNDFALDTPGFSQTSSHPAVYQSLSNHPRFRLASGQQPVTVVEYQPNHMTLKVQAHSPDVLTIADSFYPGWQATVNDQPTPINPHQTAFRQISLPEGDNLVKLTYQPRSVKLGTLISLLSAITILILIKWPNQKLLSSS